MLETISDFDAVGKYIRIAGNYILINISKLTYLVIYIIIYRLFIKGFDTRSCFNL
jgi:hypothetical protein